jgi:hypothetical protein
MWLSQVAAGLRQVSLRPAEEDIDFDVMEIRVRRQVKRLGSKYISAPEERSGADSPDVR